MLSIFNPFRSAGTRPPDVIPLNPVKTHEVETTRSDSARALKHLLKLNHAKHAILYSHDRFHNHLPHILGSAYILGSDAKRLNDIYDVEASELENWRESPGEVSDYDWREYLGDGRYQRAYVDFFEDELVLNGYDWKKVVAKYMFEGKEPMVNNLVSGLGHPLIHLGYAFELSSPSVAMEALGLSTCCYNFLHKYIDNPAYTPPKTPQYSSTNMLFLLDEIRKDTRLNDLTAQDLDANDISGLFSKHEDAVLEHWNAWFLNRDPKEQFETSQRTAATILMCSYDYNPEKSHQYDFFFVHLLTTSHAIRILLPLIPPKHHIAIVRQWWLLTVAIYITQGRPELKPARVLEDFDMKGRGWEYVKEMAVKGEYYTDAHYVKGLRALMVARETWGEREDGFWLRCGVKLAGEFDGWGGFGDGR